MQSLFGRNINILRGSKASVMLKSTPSTGLLSLLNTISCTFLFCTSICSWLKGLLVHYLRTYCNCYTTGKLIHSQIYILVSFVVLLFIQK